MKYTKNCQFCNKEYITNRRESKFCSIGCSKSKINGNKECKFCGKLFNVVNYNKNKSYCSRDCYKKDDNKIGGFKINDTLIDKWNRLYTREEINKKEEEKNKKISKIHKQRCDKLSMDARKEMSAHLTTCNIMSGSNLIELMTEKYGENAKSKIETMLYKLSIASSKRKYKHSAETIEKLRISRISNLIKIYGKNWRPTYNFNSCDIIDELGNIINCKFKHGKNGGEVYIDIGYFLDGYDPDKNTVIEFYERPHYDAFGNLNEKSSQREFNIIKYLNCKFIRINAFNPNKLKIEILNNV